MSLWLKVSNAPTAVSHESAVSSATNSRSDHAGARAARSTSAVIATSVMPQALEASSAAMSTNGPTTSEARQRSASRCRWRGAMPREGTGVG